MSIVDPTTFTLTNDADAVGTVEYVSVTQSMYAQARVPDVGLQNIATFGISGSSGNDFSMAFTNDGTTLYWYFGSSLADALASGTYVEDELFSIYADKQTVTFKKNGVDIYNVPNPVTAPAYRVIFIFSNVFTEGPITFRNVLFYPSGARGNAGTPYTLAVVEGDADILTESSFKLVSTGDTVHTLEAFPTLQGIYMQARISGFSGGNAVIGLSTPEETGQNRFIRFSFFGDGTYSLKIKGFEGNVVYSTYEAGDLLSIFLDDTSLIVYKNGSSVDRINTQGSGVENRIYKLYSYYTSAGRSTVFTDVAFYQTGERGQEGAAFTTLVPDNSVLNLAFVTSPTSFRFRTLNDMSVAPEDIPDPPLEVNPLIQTEELDGTASGLYLQFKPFVVAIGSGDSVAMGIVNLGGQTYGFNFREEGGLNVYDTFTAGGVFASGIPYVEGDKFTIYTDGTTVNYIGPGGSVQAEFVQGAYKFVASGTFVTNNYTLYDTTEFRFYPTGKTGPVGPQGPTFTTLTPLNRATVPSSTQCVLNSVVGSVSNVYTPEYFDLGSQGVVLQTTLPGVSDATGRITIAFKLTNNQFGMYVFLTSGNTYTIYNNSVDDTELATGTYTPGLPFRMYTDGRYAYASFNNAPPVVTDELAPYISLPAYLHIESSDNFTSPGTYNFNNVRFYPTGKAVYGGNGLYDFSTATTLVSPVTVLTTETGIIANITFPSTMPISTADNCLVSVGLNIPTITYATEKTCGYVEFSLSFDNDVPRFYSVYLPLWVEYDTIANRIVSSLRFTMPAMLINAGTNPKDMILYVKNNTNGNITFTGATNATVMIQTLNNNGTVIL
jgi:hypothetical protein